MGIAGAVGFQQNYEGCRRILSVLAGNRSSPIRWAREGIEFGAIREVSFSRSDGVQDLALMLDGALHNGADIQDALGVSGYKPADLIALGYARWGLGVIDRLVGDFAFALWDDAARRLVLARDSAGMRPLFYWHQGERLLFASSTRALHADPLIPREIDPEQAVRTLLFQRLDHPQTEFRELHRVMAGHAAIFEAGNCRQIRWWQPENLPTLRLRDDNSYAEALREVLDQAVGARLPPTGPVAVTLSGGLDSTAIAALAARRLRSQGRRLTAFTVIPGSDESPEFKGQITNEGFMAGLMAQAYDTIDHVLIPSAVDRDVFDIAETYFQHSDIPARLPFSAANFDRLYADVAARGCATLLGGDFGNITISYNGLSYLHAALRGGNMFGWLRLLPGLRAAGFGWKRILYLSFAPALPAAWRYRLLKAGGGAELLSLANSVAIRPEFAREIGITDDQIQNQFGDSGDSRQSRLLTMSRIDRGPRVDLARRTHGVCPTDPTADRRVVEFCLSIPEEQFILNGSPRSLIRRAMRGLVPDAILDSRKRGRQGADRHVALTRAQPRILEELVRMERSALASHCLDLPRMRQLAENWPTQGWETADLQESYCFYLANGLALGAFLRRFQGGNS